MAIRFAAAWGGRSPTIVRALCPCAPLNAVNDNRRESLRGVVAAYTAPQGRPQQAANDERVLVEALRHFARHGISAAIHARANAEAAHAADDGEAYDWWISICRQLDRRMADAFARRMAVRG
ncbi:MAG TPA: hypothetical protein VJQ77_00390 [Novosphingobium sp.]|nr:hypothetical protein [Novosphingobium sp.]